MREKAQEPADRGLDPGPGRALDPVQDRVPGRATAACCSSSWK